MGWNYPEISLEDLMELIKGFVDMLILTSGYQSSGRSAFWDSHDIKKAFQWALFFENVVRCLKKSDVYQDSVKELDAALSALTSDASFPQGFAHISSVVLSNSQQFLLEHLIHTLPLRGDHLRALLIAIIEMDLNELSHPEHGSLTEYLKKLKLENASSYQVSDRELSEKNSGVLCLNVDEDGNGKCASDYFSQNVIESLLKRQSAVSCISTIENGLQVLSTSIKNNSWIESDNTLLGELKDGDKCQMSAEQLGFITCNHWKLRNLSYILDKRTIRLVSGASMIFSAPKIQWGRVLSGLNVPGINSEDSLLETIELLLIGVIGSRWSSLINRFMSVSYFTLPASEMCYELWNVHTERSESFHFEKKTSTEEIDILNYLMESLDGRLYLLLKLSPALAAAAIPSWSPLFRLYLSELQTQLNRDSISRSCDCSQEKKEHTDCELAERIWCLYVFHKGPGANSAGKLRTHW